MPLTISFYIHGKVTENVPDEDIGDIYTFNGDLHVAKIGSHDSGNIHRC